MAWQSSSGKLGVYATAFSGGWSADAAVIDNARRGGLQGTARGSTDGGELDVLIGTGYDGKFGALTIGPTATFQYSLVGTDGSGSTVRKWAETACRLESPASKRLQGRVVERTEDCGYRQGT